MTYLENMWVSFLNAAASPEFIAEQLLTWLIFSLLVSVFIGWIADYFEARRERKAREPFENWALEIIGYNDKKQSLYWQEVERFMNSQFELWKFVKSVASGGCHIKGRTIDNALEQQWVRIDKSERLIVVDFSRIPSHLVQWAAPEMIPKNWVGSKPGSESLLDESNHPEKARVL